MSNQKILLIVTHLFDFYVHQVANLLRHAGHDVHIIYIEVGATEPIFAGLIEKVKATGIPIHLIRDRTPWLLRKMRGALFRCGLYTIGTYITPDIISQSARVLEKDSYDWVIAFEPTSVYLACKLFPTQKKKIIDFSLEVVEEGNINFQSSKLTRDFIEFERKMLPGLGGLMIQDPMRADILLKQVQSFPRERIIYYPVAVEGLPIKSKEHDYFGDQLPDRSRTRILFYGGLWNEAILNRLKAVGRKLPSTQVLIIQGGRGSVNLDEESSPTLLVSRKLIEFDHLDGLISSADIGLALYHANDLNHQFTAFSSEKVARYTRCGLPFIAFRQGNYEYLQSEEKCCELITKIEELPQAVELILRDYAKYSAASYAAYERFYRLENTSKTLLAFLENRPSVT